MGSNAIIGRTHIRKDMEDIGWADYPISLRDESNDVKVKLDSEGNFPFTLDDLIAECMYPHKRWTYVDALNRVHSVIDQMSYWQRLYCEKSTIYGGKAKSLENVICLGNYGSISIGEMPSKIRYYKEIAKFLSAKIALVDNPELKFNNKGLTVV